MTTMGRHTFRCAICGTSTSFQEIMSTNEFGSPDLDLRPAPMKRYTTPLWAQECPHCGYANHTIDATPPKGVDMAWLRSKEYTTCEGNDFADKLSSMFYHQYMVHQKQDNKQMAFYAVLCVAWMCDDSKDTEHAIVCRVIAAKLARELFLSNNDPKWAILWADNIRRANRFCEVLSNNEFDEALRGSGILETLMAFEKKLAASEDAACYTIDYALNEMKV